MRETFTQADIKVVLTQHQSQKLTRFNQYHLNAYPMQIVLMFP